LATDAAPIIPLFFSELSVATTVTILRACTRHWQDPAAPPARRGTLDPQGPLHLQLGGLSRIVAQAASLRPAYCLSRAATRAVTAAPPALPPKLACPSILRHGSCQVSSILAPAAPIHHDAVPVLCHHPDSDCHATSPDAPVLLNLYGFQLSLFCSYLCKQAPSSLSCTQ
jgi:hypothetical protein